MGRVVFHPESAFFITLLASAVSLLLAAIVQLRWPPREINFTYGYRTVRSCSSPATWDFAQPAFAWRMIRVSLVLLVLAILGGLGRTHPAAESLLAVVVMLLGVAWVWWRTECELESRFGVAEPDADAGVQTS